MTRDPHGSAASVLPPGPRWPQFWMFRQLVNPIGAMMGLARRYGDLITIKLFGQTVVFTGHPEGARAIYTADADRFDIFQPDQMALLTGWRSLLIMTGDDHRRHRRLLTPPFHGARMRDYGRIMIQSTLQQIGQWRTGVPFDVLPSLQALSLEVIIRAVFGVLDEAPAERLGAAARRYLDPRSPGGAGSGRGLALAGAGRLARGGRGAGRLRRGLLMLSGASASGCLTPRRALQSVPGLLLAAA